jgi:25S rRNA (adenine2142-N1)-methyltransferase
MSSKRKKKNKRPIPIAPEATFKSRKKARVVTSLFHKYTRELDVAQREHDDVKIVEIEKKIDAIGGRHAYQQASQLSTSFFSTSKWVLGNLARSGWLYGVPTEMKCRRKLNLLEVGAINLELLNAAKETRIQKDGTSVPKFNLYTKAIDLQSSYEGIEEADFLTLPLGKYDVVVCSMVINCVPRSDQRGLMLARLYHQLIPGGLCFLTLPRLCLTQSPYLTLDRFKNLLSRTGVGFELEEIKASPKIAFFILRRPKEFETHIQDFDPVWETSKIMNNGKQYRNDFNVLLKRAEVSGEAFIS